MRTVLVVICLWLGLSACSSSTPATMEGRWAASRFDAQVAEGRIKINIVNPKTGSSSLYWDGTAPAVGVEGQFISEANTEALKKSMLGSQDETKTFTYDGDTLSFSFTMMGNTTVIHLDRA